MDANGLPGRHIDIQTDEKRADKQTDIHAFNTDRVVDNQTLNIDRQTNIQTYMHKIETYTQTYRLKQRQIYRQSDRDRPALGGWRWS
jgi:hypothetical protein